MGQIGGIGKFSAKLTVIKPVKDKNIKKNKEIKNGNTG